jgi:hypothetical protein
MNNIKLHISTRAQCIEPIIGSSIHGSYDILQRRRHPAKYSSLEAPPHRLSKILIILVHGSVDQVCKGDHVAVMTSQVWITLKTRRSLTVAFSLASCLPVLQLSTYDSRIQWFGELVISDLFLPWASTAEINDQLYFGPRLLAHQLILDTFVACTSNVSSISCDVQAQQYEHSHSYKPQSRTCRLISVTSTCNAWLICFNWSSPINSWTRFWFFLVLNLPLLIVCESVTRVS